MKIMRQQYSSTSMEQSMSSLDLHHQTDDKLEGLIETYTGRTINPLDPDPGSIFIDDIAHSLANQCRFTGHTRNFYSVAQHCVLVADVVQDETLKLTALLHDASEAYLSDIARPVKMMPRFGDLYREYEEGLEQAIAKHFSLEWPWPKEIKEADNILLRAEQINLMFGIFRHEAPEYGKKIIAWPPTEANAQFMWAYKRYGGK